MPKKVNLSFICENIIIHYNILQDRGLFLARLRKGGYKIIVYSKDYEAMKQKFINEYNRQTIAMSAQPVLMLPQPEVKTTCDILFVDYGKQWLETKRKFTKPSTFKEYERTFIKDIAALYGQLKLKDITRAMIQNDLLKIFESTPRKAEKMQLMLTCIFDMAHEDYGIKNPMNKVELPFRKKKKGSALTKPEEKIFIDFCLARLNQKATSALLVLSLFGLRTSELQTLKVIDDNWIEVITSKELLGKDEEPRKIPITSYARKYIKYIDFDIAKNTKQRTIGSTLLRIFPKDKVKPHHPHELRYTFITRCKECGVNPEIVMLWDGHEEDGDVRASKVDRGYTDFSEEYQLQQAKLVDYEI